MPEPDDRRPPRSAADVTGAGDSSGKNGLHSDRDTPEEGGTDAARGPVEEEGPRDFMSRGYARAEEKNRAVREALEPLGPGERPGAVTLGAIFSGLVALVFWGSVFVRLFTGIEVEGREPDPVQLALFAAVMTAMSIGMWRVRYWAVLGFQMLLVLFLVAATAGLLTAQTVLQAVFTTLMIAVVGYLFYRMIKAMARIQMPSRRPPP